MMRDHRDLVRFSSAKDPDYKRVIGHIRPLMVDAVPQLRIRKKAQVLDEDKVGLIKRLFRGAVDMLVELETLPDKSTTYEWLIQRPEFVEWRNNKSLCNCLWIEGPPGYGKTDASVVTTKFLAGSILEENNHVSHREQKTLYACFFCSDKPGCSTAEDLLKSILLQIIGQFPKLAMYAEEFLDQDPTSDEAREARGPFRQLRATLTIEHMWNCLKDMLEDISLHAVFIVVNNLHHLDQNESLEKLLQRMRLEFSLSAQPGRTSTPSQYGRWLFTTFSETRDDISGCLDPTGTGLKVRKVNLRDSQFAGQIKTALTRHVQLKASELKSAKNYDLSLVFEVEKIMESKAENTVWVDIICLQLGTLPPSSGRLLIRDRLEAAARGNLKKLVKESWEWVSAPQSYLVL